MTGQFGVDTGLVSCGLRPLIIRAGQDHSGVAAFAEKSCQGRSSFVCA